MKNDPRSNVKNALMNILFFPGMGTLRAGRWVAGIGQLVIVLTGSTLVLVWFFKEMSQYYGLMFGDVKREAVGWIGVTGGVLVVIAWIWAGITSISLFREASKPAPAPPRLVPPVQSPASAQTQAGLAMLPNWRRNGEIISRTYEFSDFPEAMRFVNAVAELAEQAQHHPDMDVRWNKVTLALTTHDAGGLTDKDFALARACDAALGR